MKTERVRFIGITFRSESHCAWFVASMFFFAVFVAIIALFLFVPQMPKGAVIIPCSMLFGFHLPTAAVALWQTDYGRKNGPVYSKDCVWFNAAMAGIYIVFTVAVIIAREFFFA